MFERRSLSGELAAVRADHAPDVIVLDVDSDFETLPPAAAEDLGLLVDALDPVTHPAAWVPDDAPRPLHRYAGSDFTIGLPGDGTVTWTRQTDPPIVLCKARAAGTPDAFLDFLIAEALVQVGLDVPESFLPFFGDRYPDLDAAVPLDSASVYQIGAALYDGWLGLQTRPVFRSWADDHPGLHDAWVDAGDRLRDRVADLPGAVARGETEFPDATELACAAIKHGLDLPAPFAALDTTAYVDYGADYAVRWASKTFETLGDE
ncbi:DUF7089 family protein [Haloplanus rubicundus]|uniref:Uncharacterized protein n=1 Tax=Haloplanus rubicundus TaxID=1547898 RepID=A0A345E9M9_9EURY|nr:hypothetical protein [Haloplanus rubicundus]AXG08901.1 hypothetical protein DU484_02940 [Haloplanus rubicundus]